MAEGDDRDGLTAGRPFWSGTVSFGLVSIPVALFPGNRTGGVSLRMLAPDGTPLERRYFCSKEDEEIPWEEIVRGYEVEKGKFVVVTDDELEALEPRKSRDIDLRRFVPRESLDPVWFQRAYFLAPGGDSTKAYRLLATVMEETKRAGIATFVMRDKEYVVAIVADRGILRAETLHFAGEIRTPDEIGLPAPGAVRNEAVQKFEAAIGRRTRRVDFSEFLDESTERLEKIAHKKRKDRRSVVEVPEEAADEPGGEVIDLLEVLNRSLAMGDGRHGRRRPRKRDGSGRGLKALESKSRDELYDEAKRLDIRGRSGMSRDELIEAIRKSA